MKVNPNRDLQSVTKAARPTKETPVAKSEAVFTEADFTASIKLARKLTATPEVRADAVERAKALIADPNYPNAATIQQVAQRLAQNPTRLKE